MKKEEAVIIRLKAGSGEIKAFDDSYGEHCECQSNYKHYVIAPEDVKKLNGRLDKNHIYYMLAAVYDGDEATGAYWGCGQFIEKEGLYGFRLFVRVKSGYNSRAKDVIELSGADSNITVIKSKEIADIICTVINEPVDGRVKEICIA